MKTLARRTAGMTGADLANILNIAAVRSSAENLLCVRAPRKSSKSLAQIPTKYLEEAFDRVVVGLGLSWLYKESTEDWSDGTP